jgi:hypothetical protein
MARALRRSGVDGMRELYSKYVRAELRWCVHQGLAAARIRRNACSPTPHTPAFLELVTALEPPVKERKKPVKWDAFLRQARGDAPDAPPGKSDDSETASKPPAAKKTTRPSRAKTPAAVPLPPQNWEEVEWLQLCDALREISKDDFPVADIDDLTPWIPVVARYSFSLAASATLER